MTNRTVEGKVNGIIEKREITDEGYIINKYGKKTTYTTSQWRNALEYLFKSEGRFFGERRKRHIGPIQEKSELLGNMKCVCLASDSRCPDSAYPMWSPNHGYSDLEKHDLNHNLPNFRGTKNMNELYEHIHFNKEELKPFVYKRGTDKNDYGPGFLCLDTSKKN